MKHDGVATHSEASGVACHLNHLQHLRRHLQFNVANVERVLTAVAEDQRGLRLRVVAQHRYLDGALPIGMHQEHAQGVGLAVHHHITVVAKPLRQLHRRLGQRFLRLCINDTAPNDVSLCGRHAEEKAQEGQDAEATASERMVSHHGNGLEISDNLVEGHGGVYDAKAFFL